MHLYLGLDSGMTTFWERAAHSVNHVFSLVCLLVALVVSHFNFKGGTLVLVVSVPDHCLTFTFCIAKVVVVITFIYLLHRLVMREIDYFLFCGFCTEWFTLPLGAWNGLWLSLGLT